MCAHTHKPENLPFFGYFRTIISSQMQHLNGSPPRHEESLIEGCRSAVCPSLRHKPKSLPFFWDISEQLSAAKCSIGIWSPPRHGESFTEGCRSAVCPSLRGWWGGTVDPSCFCALWSSLSGPLLEKKQGNCSGYTHSNSIASMLNEKLSPVNQNFRSLQKFNFSKLLTTNSSQTSCS